MIAEIVFIVSRCTFSCFVLSNRDQVPQKHHAEEKRNVSVGFHFSPLDWYQVYFERPCVWLKPALHRMGGVA